MHSHLCNFTAKILLCLSLASSSLAFGQNVQPVVKLPSALPTEMIPLAADDNVSFDESYDLNYDEADKIVSKMSLRQKVGQLFILGFTGKEFTEAHRTQFNYLKPGGIILFQRNVQNPSQTRKLNMDIIAANQSSTGTKPLLMIDQEGGQVIRLKWRPPTPSALSLGMADRIDLTEKTGELTGELLSQLRFTMNLAPVVDLSDPNTRNFIGNRSFGFDPQAVQKHGTAFMRGMARAGILATVKHFPGHGGTEDDSHQELPQKLSTLAQMKTHELLPYQIVSESGLPSALMVAHLAFPNVDTQRLPATYSPTFIGKVLSQDLGYQGLIITDDLEMLGAATYASVKDRAIQAILAGNDMIMFAWNTRSQRSAYDGVYEAARAGTISEKRLNQSVRKIVAHKLFVEAKRKENLKMTPVKGVNQLIRESIALTNEVTQINLAKSFQSHSGLQKGFTEDQKFVVFSSDPYFSEEFKSVANKNALVIPLAATSKELVEARLAKSPEKVGVFYITGGGSAKLLESLKPEAKKQMLVVNSLYPGVLSNPSEYMAVLNIYTRNHMVGRWIMNKVLDQKNLNASVK